MTRPTSDFCTTCDVHLSEFCSICHGRVTMERDYARSEVHSLFAALQVQEKEIARLREALADIARGDYSDPLCQRTPEQRAREALAEHDEAVVGALVKAHAPQNPQNPQKKPLPRRPGRTSTPAEAREARLARAGFDPVDPDESGTLARLRLRAPAHAPTPEET